MANGLCLHVSPACGGSLFAKLDAEAFGGVDQLAVGVDEVLGADGFLE